MFNKQSILESGFVIVLIAILFYTVYHYVELSSKADEDVINTYTLRNNDKLKSIESAFGGKIVKVNGDVINKKIEGHTIIIKDIPYQACLRYGVNIKNFTYFAINKNIMLEFNNPPHRDKILNECYTHDQKNNLYYYYKD